MSEEERKAYIEKQLDIFLKGKKILEQLTLESWSYQTGTFSFYGRTFVCEKIEKKLKETGIWCASARIFYQATFRPPISDESWSRVLVQSHYMEVYLSRGIILVSDLGL